MNLFSWLYKERDRIKAGTSKSKDRDASQLPTGNFDHPNFRCVVLPDLTSDGVTTSMPKCKPPKDCPIEKLKKLRYC